MQRLVKVQAEEMAKMSQLPAAVALYYKRSCADIFFRAECRCLLCDGSLDGRFELLIMVVSHCRRSLIGKDQESHPCNSMRCVGRIREGRHQQASYTPYSAVCLLPISCAFSPYT
jgi:hypothetical protein